MGLAHSHSAYQGYREGLFHQIHKPRNSLMEQCGRNAGLHLEEINGNQLHTFSSFLHCGVPDLLFTTEEPCEGAKPMVAPLQLLCLWRGGMENASLADWRHRFLLLSVHCHCQKQWKR